MSFFTNKMDWKSKKGKAVIALISICIIVPLVAKYSDGNTRTFNSRLEASDNANKWIKDGGTYKSGYQDTEYYETFENNPELERIIKRNARLNNDYNQKVDKCNALISTTYSDNLNKPITNPVKINLSCEELCSMSNKPKRECCIPLADQLKNAQSLDAKETKRVRTKCLKKASIFNISNPLPSPFIDVTRSRQITKYKDVAYRECTQEIDLKQFVCRDNREDNSYRYFRY